MLMENLISDDELAALPDEPGERMFEFLRIVRPRFSNAIEAMNGTTGSKPRSLLAWHEFQLGVIGFAQGWEVDGLSRLSTPSLASYGQEDADDFRGKLVAFEGVQRAISNQRSRASLVVLSDETKRSMRERVADLRARLDLAGLTPKRKKRLSDLLDKFEAELDRSRTDWRVIVAIPVLFAGYVSDIDGAAEAAVKWSREVVQEVVETKDEFAAGLPLTIGWDRVKAIPGPPDKPVLRLPHRKDEPGE